jgi:hypothetical protein
MEPKTTIDVIIGTSIKDQISYDDLLDALRLSPKAYQIE